MDLYYAVGLLWCCHAYLLTENVFNNFSVPVSCCNTTNTLAYDTTCPAIVSNAALANKTGLVFSKV